MRKLTYYIATSADGFISRADGTLDDFSFEGEHVQDLLDEYPETIPTHLRSHLGVSAENRHFDTVLMGRRTYEVGLAAGVTSPYQHLNQFVFSSTIDGARENSITVIQDQALEVVRSLKAQSGLDVWLCGGPALASALFEVIDDVILKINPFLMGAGKPLFAQPLSPSARLQLVDRRDYESGFSLVHYSIERPPIEHDVGNP